MEKYIFSIYANIRPVTPFPALFHRPPLQQERIENAGLICSRKAGEYIAQKIEENEIR